MKSISIREFHDRTGHWLRRVQGEAELLVTDRGAPVARILPPARPASGDPFARRKLLRGVKRLLERPMEGLDSTEVISSMRDGR